MGSPNLNRTTIHEHLIEDTCALKEPKVWQWEPLSISTLTRLYTFSLASC